MSGRRLFIAVSTSFYQDPKMLEAGDGAMLLYLKGLAYSKEHLLDGYVPVTSLQLFGGKFRETRANADRLVSAGLWEETEGGWRVPYDRWCAWQTTKEQVEDLRAKRAAAGRAGMARRWGTPPAATEGVTTPVASVTTVSYPEYREHSTETLKLPLLSVSAEKHDSTDPATPERFALALVEERAPSVPKPSFERWWSSYPKKVKKAAAEKSFDRAVKAGATDTQLAASTSAWCRYWDSEGREAKHIPDPTTWLNQEHWRECPTPVPPRPVVGRNAAVFAQVLAERTGTTRDPFARRTPPAIDTTGGPT